MYLILFETFVKYFKNLKNINKIKTHYCG